MVLESSALFPALPTLSASLLLRQHRNRPYYPIFSLSLHHLPTSLPLPLSLSPNLLISLHRRHCLLPLHLLSLLALSALFPPSPSLLISLSLSCLLPLSVRLCKSTSHFVVDDVSALVALCEKHTSCVRIRLNIRFINSGEEQRWKKAPKQLLTSLSDKAMSIQCLHKKRIVEECAAEAEEGMEGGGGLCHKILMGEKCQPLNF